VTEAEGADNLAHHAICDDPIVDRERVLGNLLDEAPIKRPGLQYAPPGGAGEVRDGVKARPPTANQPSARPKATHNPALKRLTSPKS